MLEEQPVAFVSSNFEQNPRVSRRAWTPRRARVRDAAEDRPFQKVEEVVAVPLRVVDAQ